MAIYLFIDRISDGIATLLYEEGRFSAALPARALPVGAREGDWLTVSFGIDRDKKSEVKKEIDSLMDELEK
jgi:hypothetical protein